MGAQIAAHLANAGIPTLLLDIVPRDDAQSETRPSGKLPDRTAIARAGFEAAKKAKPAASKGVFIKSATLTSTMGPGIRIDVSGIGA